MADLNSAQKLKLHGLKDDSDAVVAYHHFVDVDELAAFLPEDIRLTQLSHRPFDCTSMALAFESIQINFNHVNCRLHAVGEKYPGFLTFTCLLNGHGQPVISNHRPLTQDYLWGFDPDREADLVFPGNSIHCAIHVQQDVFAACAQAMDRSELNTKFLGVNYAYLPETLPALRAYLNQLHELLGHQSPLLRKLDFQQIMLKNLLPLLIAALSAPQEKRPVPTFRRSQLVKRTNDYMQSHIDQVLTLTDLCEAMAASSRTLCYGFREIFDLSPMAYLKLLRLQGVHRALKVPETDQTVTEIATQFGFYHLGLFAHDYRQLFGELPSETLKRSR